MGIEIEKIDFSEADHSAFAIRLEQNLAVLQQLIDDPDFGFPGSGAGDVCG
jgi:hypothetical protein